MSYSGRAPPTAWSQCLIIDQKQKKKKKLLIHPVQMRPWCSTLQRWIRLLTPALTYILLRGGCTYHTFVHICDPEVWMDIWSAVRFGCWCFLSIRVILLYSKESLMNLFATFQTMASEHYTAWHNCDSQMNIWPKSSWMIVLFLHFSLLSDLRQLFSIMSQKQHPANECPNIWIYSLCFSVFKVVLEGHTTCTAHRGCGQEAVCHTNRFHCEHWNRKFNWCEQQRWY